MSRQIVTKQLGGEPKTGKEKGISGSKLVTNLSTSKPKGDVGISASGSSDSVRSSSLQGSSKDVTSLETISKSNNDRDLTVLLKTLKERTQKGQSTDAGISGGHAASLQDSVNMWLMTLKTEIETGSCTLSFQEDTPKELKTTRDLLQEITTCLKENHTRKKQENKLLIEQIENLDKEIAVLTSSRSGGWKEGDIHWQRIKHLRQKLQQVKVQPPTSINGNRDNQEKVSSKLVNQERKIQDIWAQLQKTPTTRSQDHLAMLNEIDKHLKENKRQVETLQANETLLHEHIEELQKELETSDSESNLKDIQETGKESELVTKVLLIRKQVRCKRENRVKVAGTDNQIIQKPVIDVWNLLFGIENNDPKADKDVNILLEFIHEELKKLEKTVFRVEESCLNIYQSLLGSDKPVQRKNTSKSERLEGTLTVLTMCKEEAESIRKHLNQFYSAFDVNVKGSLSRQSEQIKVTLERRFVKRAPVLENVRKMFNRTMQQKYIPSNEPNAETGRSERKEWDVLDGTADDVIAVVVDICDQVTTKYESLENTLAKREQEKEELLTRLSKMAGANLTNNNPNIADLSDPNRPTKLSEMYCELYDNAWTDAFEDLDKSGKGDKDKEQKNIQLLLEILSESYKTCENVSMRQQQAIMAALTTPTGQDTAPKDKSAENDPPSSLQSKAVTELRKLSADTFFPSVQHFFEDNCMMKKGNKSKRSIWFDKGSMRTYTMKCIELCWFMHIQAPPVHIDLTGQPGDKFDTNKFKQYTKSGNKIDFVVWPPLLLHEQGPLLSKGVAQGK